MAAGKKDENELYVSTKHTTEDAGKGKRIRYTFHTVGPLSNKQQVQLTRHLVAHSKTLETDIWTYPDISSVVFNGGVEGCEDLEKATADPNPFLDVPAKRAILKMVTYVDSPIRGSRTYIRTKMTHDAANKEFERWPTLGESPEASWPRYYSDVDPETKRTALYNNWLYVPTKAAPPFLRRMLPKTKREAPEPEEGEEEAPVKRRIRRHKKEKEVAAAASEPEEVAAAAAATAAAPAPETKRRRRTIKEVDDYE